MTQPEALRLAEGLELRDYDCRLNDVVDELRRLHAELELQKALVAEAQAMTAKVCAENESLRADAERYRWLREADEMADALIKSDCLGVCLPQREALDSQIDAARKDGSAARESDYRRGYRHGHEQRDAEVRGALV